MSMTRSSLLTLADEMADAVGSPRWGTTLKLQLLGTVHWREWRTLLNANQMLRVAQRTATTDADGRIAKSALNSGSGDATETFYRVQNVRSGNLFYQPAEFKDYPISPTEVSQPNVWYEYGDYIQLIPAVTGDTVAATVNHLPQRADLLASDTSTVVFPEGYELLLAYETAAQMLMKGAAESNLAAELKAMASTLRDEMRQDLARLSVRPMRMGYLDDRADWGSVG